MRLSTDCATGMNEHDAAQPTHLLLNLVATRHSTRAFLPKPVPRSVLEQVFATAQRAPSNSNVQPWRVKALSGKALQRLAASLSSIFLSGTPNNTKPIPEPYNKHRSALGKQLYGPEGYDIPRNDEERTRVARMRNYQFFGAPCGLMVCMDRGLSEIDILSVGIYDMVPLVGVAIGYEDPEHKINHLKGQREALDYIVEFLDD
ncbi:Nitroreductase [Phaeosphaeriaceae sp. SRC1lsM3a]|nr:Nitroreductase [Stagonospora sp. SRC1lsM3a]